MYQSKLFARHNKNPLALIYTYMYASVCVCVSACVMDCICMCVLWLCCKSANTPCCQLADIKARESFFLLLCCRVVEGGPGRPGQWESGREGEASVVKPHV